MMPISGVNTGAVQPLTTAERVLGASKVQKPEEESRQLSQVEQELRQKDNDAYRRQNASFTQLS